MNESAGTPVAFCLYALDDKDHDSDINNSCVISDTYLLKALWRKVSFSALMLFVGWQDEQLACKNVPVIHTLLFGRPGRMWSNSRKEG